MSVVNFAQQTARVLTGLGQMIDLSVAIDAAYTARGYAPSPPEASELGAALVAAGVPADQLGSVITMLRALEDFLSQVPAPGAGSYLTVLARLRGDV